MQKTIFFIFIVFMVSCSNTQEKAVNGNYIDDRLQQLFVASQNLKITEEERLAAINKVFYSNKLSLDEAFYGQVLYQKNWLHLALGQYDSLKLWHQHFITKVSGNENDYYLAEQYYLMAYYFDSYTSYPDSAFINYNLSKGYFEKLRDSNWIGKNLLNMATIQKDQNDFFGSKETLTDALPFLEGTKDSTALAGAFNTLGTNHRKLLNFSDGIKYYNQAITTTQSKAFKLIYKNNLGALYIDQQEYDKAISILTSLIKDSISFANQKEYARVLDNLAYAKWLNNNPVRVKDFLEPLRIRQQNNYKRGQIASYTHLGEFYSKTNSKKAITYFDSVIQLSKTLKIPRAEKDALKFLMALQSKKVDHYVRYLFLQDSLYQNGLKVKTQFAKYKYDDKVSQEENLRLEKKNAEKELEVVKQRNQKLAFSAIGSLLLLTIGFLSHYFAQRTKRLKEQNKTAKLEAIYETEAELSRKLHDDFGGKLNHAMMLLQNGTDSADVLNVVDDLYNQSRDISREINDVDTGPAYKDTLMAMIGNYCKNTKLIATGSTDVDWAEISPITKKTLYKVLQELMINMQKHSEASLVSLAFLPSKKVLKISYLDNGIGASKKQLLLKNGLGNTEKRIQAIGGTIIFDSSSDKGFEALVEIPN
ncbi:hypothetical protein [Croceitalea sp. P059]|uniref:tetratricopeptide repeat-containing sensor histidine kinase n=1 Tax=Croceitalea sp. P059 TaxID=3075601 RepID=UPI0028849AAA|nr:hypothetical protein [Croceitalea sp. P059]MDT0539080.1 hypothetical protein [Croceitalea sp. P059]